MTNQLLKGKSLKGDASFLRLKPPKDRLQSSHQYKPESDDSLDLSLFRDMVESDKGLVEYIIQKRKKLMQEFSRLELRTREIEKKKAELRKREERLYGDEEKLTSEINEIKSQESQLTKQLKMEEEKLGKEFQVATKELNNENAQNTENVQSNNASQSKNDARIEESKGEKMVQNQSQPDMSLLGGKNDSPVSNRNDQPDMNLMGNQENQPNNNTGKKISIPQSQEDAKNEEKPNPIMQTNPAPSPQADQVKSLENLMKELNKENMNTITKSNEEIKQYIKQIKDELHKEVKERLEERYDNLINEMKKNTPQVTNKEVLELVKEHKNWLEKRLGELEGNISVETKRAEKAIKNLETTRSDKKTPKAEEKTASKKIPPIGEHKQHKEKNVSDTKTNTSENIQDLLKKIDDKDSDNELNVDPEKLSDEQKKEHIYKMINEVMSCIGEEDYEKAKQLLREITVLYNMLQGHIVDKHRIYEEVSEIKRYINSKTNQ